jgi:hypothetical protein
MRIEPVRQACFAEAAKPLADLYTGKTQGYFVLY